MPTNEQQRQKHQHEQANASRSFAVFNALAQAIETKNLTTMDEIFAPTMNTTQAVCFQPTTVVVDKAEFLAGQKAQCQPAQRQRATAVQGGGVTGWRPG